MMYAFATAKDCDHTPDRIAAIGCREAVMSRMLAAGLLLCGAAFAQAPVPSLPEGPGLAANYPGDVGLAKDPRIVFVEDFEAGNVDELRPRWDEVKNAPIMALADDAPPGSGGKRSLLMTHVGGRSEGGHLFRRLQPGFDRLFARFYTKFDPDCAPIGHFFHLGGRNPPTPFARGGAGIRPRPDQWFGNGVEPTGKSWTWDFYTYWPEMRASPPRGQTWGNSFIHDRSLEVVRGKWICAEVMMKMNDLPDSNGEMAMWIEGKRVSHLGKGFPRGRWEFGRFYPGEGGEGVRWDDAKGAAERTRVPPGGEPFEGFRWRGDERLRLNYLWVLLYLHSPQDHVSKVWFDHIVVSTEYIGPIKPIGTDAKTLP